MFVLLEIDDAGDTGETDQMSTLSEVVVCGETDRLDAVLESCIKSCVAGTDSPRQTPMEDVQIPMVQIWKLKHTIRRSVCWQG